MADTKINIELDPKKAIDPINELIDAIKKLSDSLEQNLGKEAPKSIIKMEEAAERGTSRIKGFFSDLKNKLKEDLKTAFDVGQLAAGLNLSSQIGSGIKEVFNLERAFDKLNTRLQLTGKAYQDFKQQIGTSVAKTGQKLEDVFPGVEVASSKGNIKSSKDLGMIAEDLAKVKASTGEGTESLADTVTEILKSQGQKITGGSFRETLNALQGARVSGSFRTAGDAGSAIQHLSSLMSPEQMKSMGLGTRELGGLAAMASKGGSHGQDILQHILKTATEAGGKEKLNDILGSNIFKGGKLDVGAFGKVDKKRFGQYSEQALSSALGGDQADLSRFLDSMKGGMGEFKKVVSGSNETSSQFETATDNLASGIDKFKEKSKNLVRSVGDDLAESANELIKGKLETSLDNLKHAGNTLLENKGIGAGIAGTAVGAAVLTGGGLNKLFKKMPGGGTLGGIMGGEMAKAAGVQPVYVTNASEIGAGLGGIAGSNGGASGKLLGGLSVVGAALSAAELGKSIAENESVQKLVAPAIDTAFQALGLGGSSLDLGKRGEKVTQHEESHDKLISAVARGTEQGVIRAKKNQKVQLTNPSNPQHRGGHM